MISMIYPISLNIKDSYGNPTPYYVDGACNVYQFDGSNLNPIHVHTRKKDGRPIVTLNINGEKKTYLVYRLLMQSYYNMSDNEFRKYVVDHVDCDSSHNDFTNFELVTQAENMRRAGMNNLMPRGEEHFNSKYSDQLVYDICQDICNGIPRSEIMKSRSVNGQLIDDIRSGRSHKSISKMYIDKGFQYKICDKSDQIRKATEVCELLQSGYSVPQVSSITGYGRNFVEPIFNKRTFKYVSQNYNF